MWLKAKTVPHRKLFLPGIAEYAIAIVFISRV